MVCGAKFVEEFRKLPDDVLSLSEASNDVSNLHLEAWPWSLTLLSVAATALHLRQRFPGRIAPYYSSIYPAYAKSSCSLS